jgi:hypothetical protein
MKIPHFYKTISLSSREVAYENNGGTIYDTPLLGTGAK